MPLIVRIHRPPHLLHLWILFNDVGIDLHVTLLVTLFLYMFPQWCQFITLFFILEAYDIEIM